MMTEEREIELIWINRVLAALVVVLFLMVGYFIAEKESLLRLEGDSNKKQQPKIASVSGILVPLASPSSSSVTELLGNFEENHVFTSRAVGSAAIHTLLWSGQGVVTEWGDRTTPSYKSAFPLKLWLIARNVEGLPAGVYEYIPENDGVVAVSTFDDEAFQMDFSQLSLTSAPAVIIVGFDKVQYIDKYGESASHLPLVETGNASQNMNLTAADLELDFSQVELVDEQLLKDFIGVNDSIDITSVLVYGYSDQN